MNILRVMVNSVLKRPVLAILPAVAMLVLVVINSYNPVLPIILGLSSATGSSVFEGLVSTLELLLDPGIITGIVLFILGAVLLVSLLAGVLLSGYFHVIGATLGGIGKTEGDYFAGTKKYFGRVFLITLRVTLFSALLSGFMAVAAVPSIIITRAAATAKPELLPAALFVDLLTVGVLFFSLMFSRIYLFFWYPAAMKDMKNPFRSAKCITDGYFWQITGRFIVFDVVFAVFQYLILITGPIALKLLLGWLFSTIFFIAMVVFIFYTFGLYANVQNSGKKMQD